jgi:hypothetical protein
MPTNLPDPRKPKPQKIDETILNALVVLTVLAMAVACALTHIVGNRPT